MAGIGESGELSCCFVSGNVCICSAAHKNTYRTHKCMEPHAKYMKTWAHDLIAKTKGLGSILQILSTAITWLWEPGGSSSPPVLPPPPSPPPPPPPIPAPEVANATPGGVNDSLLTSISPVLGRDSLSALKFFPSSSSSSSHEITMWCIQPEVYLYSQCSLTLRSPALFCFHNATVHPWATDKSGPLIQLSWL